MNFRFDLKTIPKIREAIWKLGSLVEELTGLINRIRAMAAPLWRRNGIGAYLTPITPNDTVFLGDGTLANPAYSFLADQNIGMLRVGGDELGFATSSQLWLRIDYNGVIETYSGRIKNIVRITSVDSPYAVRLQDHIILCDTDGGNIEIDLPAGVDGTEYAWENVGNSGNELDVDPNGLETILGLAAGVPATFDDDEGAELRYEATEGWR